MATILLARVFHALRTEVPIKFECLMEYGLRWEIKCLVLYGFRWAGAWVISHVDLHVYKMCISW